MQPTFYWNPPRFKLILYTLTESLEFRLQDVKAQLKNDIHKSFKHLQQSPTVIKIVRCESNPTFSIIITYIEDCWQSHKRFLKKLLDLRKPADRLYCTSNVIALIRQDGSRSSHQSKGLKYWESEIMYLWEMFEIRDTAEMDGHNLSEGEKVCEIFGNEKFNYF